MNDICEEMCCYPRKQGLPLDAARHSGISALRFRNGARSLRHLCLYGDLQRGPWTRCRTTPRKHKELTGLGRRCRATFGSPISIVDCDSKLQMLGVLMADIFSTHLEDLHRSVYVNDFNMFNRIYSNT